jgi:hypothetical protein
VLLEIRARGEMISSLVGGSFERVMLCATHRLERDAMQQPTLRLIDVRHFVCNQEVACWSTGTIVALGEINVFANSKCVCVVHMRERRGGGVRVYACPVQRLRAHHRHELFAQWRWNFLARRMRACAHWRHRPGAQMIRDRVRSALIVLA